MVILNWRDKNIQLEDFTVNIRKISAACIVILLICTVYIDFVNEILAINFIHYQNTLNKLSI